MLPVLLQRRLVQDSQTREQPGQYRNLEDQSHNEYYGDECGHIGIQGNLGNYVLPYLIAGQEPERDGENHDISHYTAYIEKYGHSEEGQLHAFFLPIIKGGSHKKPYFE